MSLLLLAAPSIAAPSLAATVARPATAPGNDDAASCSVIATTGFAGSTTFSGTTAGAGSEPNEPHGSGEATVWFSFTATQPGLVYLLPVQDGPGTDVHVYTQAGSPDCPSNLGALAEVGVSSSDVGGSSSDRPDAAVIPAIEGVSYYIQVEDPSGAGAAFSYDLLQPTGGEPPNDDFAAAASLDSALSQAAAGNGSADPAAVGYTADATTEPGEPGPGGSPPSKSVWFELDVPAAPSAGSPVSITLTAQTLPAEPTGISLGLWSGSSLASLTPLGAASAGGSGQAVLPLPAGASGRVYVSVDGPETWFTLDLAEQNVPPPDNSPPVIVCRPPGGWTSSPDVPCTASDSGSPLVHASDASFTLVADVPEGVASASAVTDSHGVCNQAGNCATAGPYTIEVDRSAPAVDCTNPPSGWSADNVTITCSASDTGSGLADLSDASFSLSTTVPAGSEDATASFPAHPPVCDQVGNCTPVPDTGTAKVDRAPPTVHCDGPPSGWTDSQGSVSCTAHDAGSGLAQDSEKSFSLTTSVPPATADATAHTDSVRVCDLVGNCTVAGPVGPFRVDLTMPAASCSLPTGWTRGDSLDIACSASDAASGLAASSPATFTLHASIPAGIDGTATSGSQRICSLAGDCTTAGPYPVSLADAPPQITCASVPTTWQAGAVTVDCEASDAGAGLSDPADAHFGLVASIPPGATDGAVAFGRKTVCDTVGNCATSPTLPSVAIDQQPPSLHCAPVPSGVQDMEVVIACSASDSGSGLADPADASFELTTSVGAGHDNPAATTSSRRVCDAVGNCVTAGPFTADVDLRSAPAGAAPRIESPGTVLVLAAIAGGGSGGHGSSPLVPVPFDPPATAGGVGIVQTACSPGPAALFRLGLTLVTCGAIDQADQASEASFWVSASLASALAPLGDARQGAMWRAVGAGFSPGSAVSVELGSARLATTKADAAGRVDTLVTIPLSTPIGDQTLVVRGRTASGEPLLVVTPIVVAVSRTHATSDALVGGAPAPLAASVTMAMPRRGPALPPAHLLPVAGRPNGTAGLGLAPPPRPAAVTGTTLPPAGTTAPPAATTAPPAGTTAPPAGTTAPPAGTTAPPAGTSGVSSTTPAPGAPHGSQRVRAAGHGNAHVSSGRHGGTHSPSATSVAPPTTATPAPGPTAGPTAGPSAATATGTGTGTGSSPNGSNGRTPSHAHGGTTPAGAPSGTPATTQPSGPASGTTGTTNPSGVAIRPSSGSHHGGSSSGDLAAVLGGTIGGVLVVTLLVGLAVLTRRRRLGAPPGGPGESVG